MDNTLFRQLAKKIHIFQAQTRIDDPFEKTTTTVYLNPIPIDAIISTIAPEKLVWKFYGKKVMEAKELIVKKKVLKLIRTSYKILIDGTEYYAYNDTQANFTIQELDDDFYKVNLWRVE